MILRCFDMNATSQAGINVVELVNLRAGDSCADSGLFAQRPAVNGVHVSWFE
jgi:hypothetical protein